MKGRGVEWVWAPRNAWRIHFRGWQLNLEKDECLGTVMSYKQEGRDREVGGQGNSAITFPNLFFCWDGLIGSAGARHRDERSETVTHRHLYYHNNTHRVIIEPSISYFQTCNSFSQSFCLLYSRPIDTAHVQLNQTELTRICRNYFTKWPIQINLYDV